VTRHRHPEGQVLSCPCGARLFDPFPSERTYPNVFVPSLYNRSHANGAQRLAWKRAHEKCEVSRVSR
jgi:hypothetical protein